MLREIEISALAVDHIELSEKERRVTLTWPGSKMDQERQTVKRVLQCCDARRACDRECPYKVSKDPVTKVSQFGLQCCSFKADKTLANKAQLVKAWKERNGKEVSGHSARRTGALAYVRAGWAILQVAYLGRWKSSVIYQYAEEALQSLPVNDPKLPSNKKPKEYNKEEREVAKDWQECI